MYVLPDIATRFARMQGRPTLLFPGTDHAGIETQFVYEQKLAKEGKSRFDLGQDAFYDAVMQFTLDSESNMIDQMRSLGLSADWSKKKFTLDEDIVQTVLETFKKMYGEGLIYRGNRIVNWDPGTQSAYADLEIKYVTREDYLYTLNYGNIQIATTRPETIFADAAVAVHPEDKRYKDLLGQEATIPLINRKIQIIADEAVSMEEGSGALKVTPAHDKTDFDIGLRHNLPQISVIDLDGKMINVPEKYAGYSVAEAREKVVTDLEEAGVLVKKDKITHQVATQDRSGEVIEPLITEQWYLRTPELNKKVIEAIEKDDVTFIPPRFKKIALEWLRQEHDWCISRQIWWGIRIPVYYKVSNDPDKEPYIVALNEQEAEDYYGEGNYVAETDTFDTWFSSGQWAYATLMATDDFEQFYPSTTMATARDILHKWVTRMIMFGLYRTENVPFENVYLWGMVTDEHGKKMSKSKGNVIDPLELTDKYGTDSLRLALAIGISAGNNGPLSERKVMGYRNFCNKLWNVSRFILANIDEKTKADDATESIADAWMLDRLHHAVEKITQDLEAYNFTEAGTSVYELLWRDFADWYIEAAKTQKNESLLLYGLQTILKLLHPFAPFVTEAIWQQLPDHEGDLITADWPKAPKAHPDEAAEFSQLQTIITEVRTLAADMGFKSAPLYHMNNELAEKHKDLIQKLAPISSVEQVTSGKGLHLLSTRGECWLDIDDEAIKRYGDSLQQRIGETEKNIQGFKGRLGNENYVKKAPKALVEETKEQLEQARQQLETLQFQLKHLGESVSE